MKKKQLVCVYVCMCVWRKISNVNENYSVKIILLYLGFFECPSSLITLYTALSTLLT